MIQYKGLQTVGAQGLHNKKGQPCQPGCTASRMSALLRLLAIAAVSATGTERRLQFAMDDTTIRTAVTAWLSDASAAEATYGLISTWETSGVTDISKLFQGASSFNEDISAWDTSGVTTMERMFEGASAFNQPLSDWRVDSVTSMDYMFEGASTFDQDLGWCVKTGVDLAYAFKDAGCASTSCGVVQGGCPTPVPTTRAPTASPAPVAVSITDEGHCLHCYVYLSILFACLVL